MIQVRHLSKKYGDHFAVRDLSFSVQAGRIYGFLGPNGAGKSTTMNMITGCLASTEGEIKVNGFDICEQTAEAKRSIGYLPENPPLYTDMTPYEYLRFVGQAKGLRGAELSVAVSQVMEQTSLTSLKDRLIANLSKGYRQRVGIAQAILGNPPIVILDEPTVGLDPKQIIEIRRLILSLKEHHTVILSSHILPEISAVCDNVIILSHGKLVADDSLENMTSYLTGNRTTQLTVKGSENELKMALNEIEGILSYEILPCNEENVFDVTMESDRNTDIRDTLFYALSRQNLPIYRLETKVITLEDVFLRLTADEENQNMKNGLQWNESLVQETEIGDDDTVAEDADETEAPDSSSTLFGNGGTRQ